VLALFAALIGPYFIDWSSYRTAFEKEASRALGQPVEVRGTADARLLPFPSLAFSDVAIGKDVGGRPMMTVKTFSMDAELAPFLSGVIRIFDMRLDRPEATVRIETDGTLNWALSHKPGPVGEVVVLERVAVSDAVIRVVDAQNGREHRLDDIDATLSARALAGPWIIEGKATIAKRRGAFEIRTGVSNSGSVRATARFRPDDAQFALETEGDAGIEDAKPRYDGNFTLRIPAEIATAQNTLGGKLSAVARGDFMVDNERLRIDEYRMEFGNEVDPYVVTGEATIDTGPKPEFLLVADGQQVELGGIKADDKTTRLSASEAVSVASISIRERLNQLNSLLARLPPPPMPGRVDIALPAIVGGDTTMRDIAISARPEGESWKIETFAASLPGRTKVEVSGNLIVGASPSFSGDMIVASSQPSGLANWLTGSVDPIIRQLGQAGFSANVDLTEQLQRFNRLEVAVGPAILTGFVERQSPSEGVGSLSVDLSGDRFDIDAIRALATLAGFGEVGEKSTQDNSSHGQFSARISADVLTIGDYAIGGVETTMLLRDGALELDRFAFADLAGSSGVVAGKLEGGLVTPTGKISGSIKAPVGDGLLALAARLDQGNTIINRLRGNGGAFDQLDAVFDLELNGAEPASLSAKGKAGGSSFSIVAERAPSGSAENVQNKFEIVADNPDFSGLALQAGFAALPFGGGDAGRLELSIDRNDAITLKAVAGDTVMTAKGTGKLPRDGQLTGAFDVALQSPDIEPVLLVLGQAMPQSGTGTSVGLTASVALSDAAYQVSEIKGDVGGNPVSGRLEFSRQSDVLSATGNLAVGNGELNWLTEWVLGPQFQEADGGTWNDLKFLPPFAGAAEFDIALSAGQFELGRAGMTKDFSGQVNYKQGRFELLDAKANWQGGELSGGFNLDNPDGTVLLSGHLELEGASLPEIEQAIAGAAPVKGTVSMSARIEGSGGSVQELVGALTGGGEIKIDDFVLEGVNPASFEAILLAADDEEFKPETDAVAALAAKSLGEGSVVAKSVVMPFTITNGMQRFSPVSIQADGATVTSEGRIDLTSFKVESKLSLSFDPGMEALPGTLPELTIGLSGLLRDPGKTLDVSALTNYLSIRAFERERRRVELLQAGVLEKQRLRRVMALVSENEEIRAAEAAAAEIERQREEEAARLAEEERKAAEAERKAAEEAARRAAEELQHAEDAARQAEDKRMLELEEEAREAEELRRQQEEEAQEVKPESAVERKPLAPAGTQGSASSVNPTDELVDPALRPPPTDPILPGNSFSEPSLDFNGLPGVERF